MSKKFDDICKTCAMIDEFGHLYNKEEMRDLMEETHKKYKNYCMSLLKDVIIEK